jgi:hypothetical protein
MDETYIKECKENAIRKKKLEMELLHTKCISIPIESSIFENYVYLNSSPGTLESSEIAMEWVRDIRLGADARRMLYHQISSHEGFIGLYAINSLRKSKNPNFLYFHGVVEIKGKETTNYPTSPRREAPSSPKLDFDDIMRTQSTFYALSEDLFINRDIFPVYFKEICEKENWTVVMGYFLSLLLSLYNANKDIYYTNYDLNMDNIMMRSMENPIFDVEYNFKDKTVWVTNYGYIPTITRFSKSYTKISVEGLHKSFAYNNLTQIPFEEKGIYCDRGFVISDAYAILMSILETTQKINIEVYNKLVILLPFFTKEEPKNLFGSRYFIPYFDKTSNLKMEDFIDFILKIYPEFVSPKPKNDVLRCIGNNLEIKSKSFEYYSVKNTIQLYDLIKYYNTFVNESNSEKTYEIVNKSIQYYSKFYEKENTTRDTQRQKELESILNNHFSIFEVPESLDIFLNKNYVKLFKDYMNSCILYFNSWERLKSGIKIMSFLEGNSPIFKEINDKYNQIFENNKNYFDFMYQNLMAFRNLFRSNLDLFNQYKSTILFLECLE